LVSYKDIQRETGLSLSTISKYFNGGNLLEDNRKAIGSAVALLDYRPNGFGRGLRLQRSGTVGVVLPVLNNDFHLTIIASVETALRDAGISVIVASSPTPQEKAVELLLGKMVDGIIAVPSPHDLPALQYATGRMPVVIIDWDAEELDTDAVFLDNVGAGVMAARHILDHGHTRVALIGGDPAVSTMRLRASGFREELTLSGHALEENLDRSGPLVMQTGYEAMGGLLSTRDRPTAVFCTNYELTLGALIALNESGLRLGRDISMVGFDGLELAQATVPRLTVIAQPVEEIGTRAAQLIQGRLTQSDPPSQSTIETLRPRLVAGGSVARLENPAA